MKLGRLPHDPDRVARVARHQALSAALPPAAVPWADLRWTPTLCDNDTLPTCTVAGLMNSARMWALVHGFDLLNDDPSLLAFYAAVAGCPDTAAAIGCTDGLVMLDVLEYAQRAGFHVGEQAPLVPAFLAIDVTSAAALKSAIHAHGMAYIGVTLREADVAPSATWTGGTDGAGGVVGGHCVGLWCYDESGFGVATWGRTMRADARWVLSRIEEAYAVAWTFPIAM